MFENQEDELHRESDPEEQVEFNQTEEDLVMGEESLDPAVCAKEFIDFPPKLCVDLPTQGDVGDLGDGDDYWNDNGECVDGYVGGIDCRCLWDSSDFGDLDDGVEEEEGVEDAEDNEIGYVS